LYLTDVVVVVVDNDNDENDDNDGTEIYCRVKENMHLRLVVDSFVIKME